MHCRQRLLKEALWNAAAAYGASWRGSARKTNRRDDRMAKHMIHGISITIRQAGLQVGILTPPKKGRLYAASTKFRKIALNSNRREFFHSSIASKKPSVDLSLFPRIAP